MVGKEYLFMAMSPGFSDSTIFEWESTPGDAIVRRFRSWCLCLSCLLRCCPSVRHISIFIRKDNERGRMPFMSSITLEELWLNAIE